MSITDISVYKYGLVYSRNVKTSADLLCDNCPKKKNLKVPDVPEGKTSYIFRSLSVDGGDLRHHLDFTCFNILYAKKA